MKKSFLVPAFLLTFTLAWTQNTFYVSAGGLSLVKAVNKAAENDVIIIEGKITSDTVLIKKDGITITGKDGAEIDFTPTFRGTDRALIQKAIDEVENKSHTKLNRSTDPAMIKLNRQLDQRKGFKITGSRNVIENLKVYGAADNGIYISGHENIIRNVEIYGNHDAGLQISAGGSKNQILSCYAHHNADEWNGGENADGFAPKFLTGPDNLFKDCVAEYNSDDGWDCFAATASQRLENCRADKNGLLFYGNGNGYKLGGIHPDYARDFFTIHPGIKHVLINCSAAENTGKGFDRNNQAGVITLINCHAEKNIRYNYYLPQYCKSQKLTDAGLLPPGEKVEFGTAVVINCTSAIGKDDFSGARVVKE